MSTAPKKPPLNPKQAAERLRVSPRTLADWRHDGKGPAFYRVGEGVRAPVMYTEAAIAEYELRTNRVIPS